jgi:hypothetical protein
MDQTGFFEGEKRALLEQIEATRRHYWELVAQLKVLDRGAVTRLAQLVDEKGNVYRYNGDPNAPMLCGQLVGRAEPVRLGWSGWGLESAAPPFTPPPPAPPKPKRGRSKAT